VRYGNETTNMSYSDAFEVAKQQQFEKTTHAHGNTVTTKTDNLANNTSDEETCKIDIAALTLKMSEVTNMMQSSDIGEHVSRQDARMYTHELTEAKNTIAAEVKCYGSLSAAAASYSGVVQRHMQTTEGRLRMMAAYESASVGDVFLFVRDDYNAHDADVLGFLLGMHKLLGEEPEWHRNSMELQHAPQYENIPPKMDDSSCCS